VLKHFDFSVFSAKLCPKQLAGDIAALGSDSVRGCTMLRCVCGNCLQSELLVQ